MEYKFSEIEQKWQQYWKDNRTYTITEDHSKPKFYILDMFPYPSGAGLHVGHPLGYIASDIYARYKRHKGFNVLHPMGYDAFGLPAEQYAIQTGQHPAITTEKNITRYRQQLDKIGFSYDWEREVRTSDPEYYKWTQWVFIQMFKHWFNNKTQKAEPISQLIEHFEKHGTQGLDASASQPLTFTSAQWKQYSDTQQQEILLNYRIAYLAEAVVNWCPALGTVLANDEVKDGVSLRGGYPVYQKRMKQWSLRVSAYAERLLKGLETIEWSESLVEIQRNWIGCSNGAVVYFKIDGSDQIIEIFTTRPDTIFGATFMVLAPEHSLVKHLTTPQQQVDVESYIEKTQTRTERERMVEAKTVSGVFTGSYAINPLTNKKIPIWIADYVLSGYGTGAIMAVPAHDSRDFAFAKHFNLPIIQVVVAPNDQPGNVEQWTDSYDSKEGIIINSGPINGQQVAQAIDTIIGHIEKTGAGYRQTNYRLRDAIFSRQRYWGEPFPVYYKDGLPQTLNEDKLPLELPKIDTYLPTEDGQPPLGRADSWNTPDGHPYELSTMPGFAGSSAYYLRYMDPKNSNELVSQHNNQYWQDVDIYIGGTEHATGHLIYSRFWNKFLYDIGIVCKDEPFKKLINQGLIQGRSNFVYRLKDKPNTYVSKGLKEKYETIEMHVDVSLVHNDLLDIEAFKQWRPEFESAQFILEDNKYHCGWAIEKMSKSMYNVVNPDDIIEQYGADTLRMYEMFLGPLELSKPWDTKGIDGVSRFLKKLWRLFYDKESYIVNNDSPTNVELKVLHKTIKKITEDIERFSFNTSVSAFMICVNELSDLKCHKKAVLEQLLILLNPFAPHITEELWSKTSPNSTLPDQRWPQWDEQYLAQSSFDYPISFNGKVRFKIAIETTATPQQIENTVLADERTKKIILQAKPKKVIVVPNKIVNIVI